MCSSHVGRWTNFELEQEEILPGSVRQIVRLDGIEQFRNTYKRLYVLDAVNMNVYISNRATGTVHDLYGQTSAEDQAKVRNVFIEGLLCEDPCKEKNQCETFLDSCQQQSKRFRQLGSFSIPTNYILSFDVKIASDAALSEPWRSIIEFGDGSYFYVFL